METYVMGLALWAFATAMLSAILGMAGGISLLAAMLLYLDPLVAIPLHGVIQLVSNISRTAVQRKHVRWGLMARFAIFLLPAGFLGFHIIRDLDPALGRILIGFFVLTAVWIPRSWLNKMGAGKKNENRTFVFLGGLVGFLSMTVGATGPLIAPFFLGLGFSRQAIVGTKAACQITAHLSKILIFGIAGFAFSEHLVLLISLSVVTILGTLVGSRLLDKFNEKAFQIGYRSVLTLVALVLIGRGVL